MADVIETVPRQLLIGGRWVDASGGATFEVTNPADDAVLARIADGTPADGEGKVFDFAPSAEQAKGTAWDGDAVAAVARDITLEVFALDESASVQATLYKMAQRIITEQQHVLSVTYKLPNKHYVPVDMKYIGIDNMSPYVIFASFVCLY